MDFFTNWVILGCAIIILMNKTKKFFILGTILFFVSIIFTFLIKNFDVGLAGDTNTLVGFSGFNSAVFHTFGVNFSLYKITELAGFLPLLLVAAYAIIGLVQLLKRKSLKKVNRGLLVFGGFLICVFITYILFDKLALNFRPVLIDGELEPSFPSSHTMLSLCICFGAIFLNMFDFKKYHFTKFLNVTLALLAIFITTGRFLSGVHWATDIIGGVLFAATFLAFYLSVLSKNPPRSPLPNQEANAKIKTNN